MKIFGFPRRSGQHVLSNSWYTASSSNFFPSAPNMYPSSPWERMHTTQQSPTAWPGDWENSCNFFTISWNTTSVTDHHYVIVSGSDILGPIDYFSDIEILVSFERDMFADFSFKNKMKIFLFFMSISPLCNKCLKHQEQCICQIYGCYIFINTLVVNFIR